MSAAVLIAMFEHTYIYSSSSLPDFLCFTLKLIFKDTSKNQTFNMYRIKGHNQSMFINTVDYIIQQNSFYFKTLKLYTIQSLFN